MEQQRWAAERIQGRETGGGEDSGPFPSILPGLITSPHHVPCITSPAMGLGPFPAILPGGPCRNKARRPLCDWCQSCPALLIAPITSPPVTSPPISLHVLQPAPILLHVLPFNAGPGGPPGPAVTGKHVGPPYQGLAGLRTRRRMSVPRRRMSVPFNAGPGGPPDERTACTPGTQTWRASSSALSRRAQRNHPYQTVYQSECVGCTGRLSTWRASSSALRRKSSACRLLGE